MYKYKEKKLSLRWDTDIPQSRISREKDPRQSVHHFSHQQIIQKVHNAFHSLIPRTRHTIWNGHCETVNGKIITVILKCTFFILSIISSPPSVKSTVVEQKHSV